MKFLVNLTFFLSLTIGGAVGQQLELAIFKYDNGVVSSEGYMLNGKPEGYWKTYYEDGLLKSEGNRLNQQLDSIWKFYSPTGSMTQQISYKDG